MFIFSLTIILYTTFNILTFIFQSKVTNITVATLVNRMDSYCWQHACPEGFSVTNVSGFHDISLLISSCCFSLWHSTHTKDKWTHVFKHANRPSSSLVLYKRMHCNTWKSLSSQTKSILNETESDHDLECQSV